MELYKAGETSGTVTVDSRTLLWRVINKTATTITVTFYGDGAGNSPGITITIPSINTAYVDVDGDFQRVTASGGTIDYMVFV